MNNEGVDTDADIDPNSTLGRKQLIKMLKERYGNEMESFRLTGDMSEKERIRKERQKERDLRHKERLALENRELNYQSDVHHSPAVNGSHEHYSGTGSEGSDDSLQTSKPNTQRRFVSHIKTTKHRIVSRSDSEDEGRKGNKMERSNSIENGGPVHQSKRAVFLQNADEVKRVNLHDSVKSLQNIKALFVTSFPDKLTMLDFEEGLKSVYIKDMESGTYYMLEDMNDILNRSFLKIHENQIRYSNSSFSDEIRRASTNSSNEYSTTFNAISGISPREERSKTCPVEYENVPHTHTHSYSSDGDYNQIHAARDTNNHSNSSLASNKPIHQTPLSPNAHTHNAGNEIYNSNELRPTDAEPESPHVIKIRAGSMTSSSSKGESVEDQLDDLSELLKVALDGDDHHDFQSNGSINLKGPGKLDPTIMEDFHKEAQLIVARKNTLPKHYQPTIIVKAQEKSENKQKEPTITIKSSPKASPKTYVKMTINKQSSNEMRRGSSSKRLSDSSSHKSKDSSDGELCDVTDGNSHDVAAQTSPNVSEIKNDNTVTNSKPLSNTNHTEVWNFPKKDDRMQIDNGIHNPSTISDNLMEEIMNLEQLELKARGNYNLPLRNSNRSSTASSNSKSSFHCEEDRAVNQDSKGQDNLRSVVSNVQDTPLNDIRSTDISASIEDSHDLHEYKNSQKEENVLPPKQIDDNTYTNDPTSVNHLYATVSKVPELPTSSTVTTTFSSTTESVKKKKAMNDRECVVPLKSSSVSTNPDFVELEQSARSVHVSLQHLRKELSQMRKSHVDATRSFKADIQKKVLEFRKKASRVDEFLQQRLDASSSIIFANEHPVRERRHRLTNDQLEYNRKMGDTERRMKILEKDMERVRVSVVSLKRVDDPEKLKHFHEELTSLTKGVAELKNRFHGLHDMLKIVMPDERKIISLEERFLDGEPKNLEALIERCKVLSGTLFTLQRLASVQLGDGVTHTHKPDSQSAIPSSASANIHHAPAEPINSYEDLKGKRSVRFSKK